MNDDIQSLKTSLLNYYHDHLPEYVDPQISDLTAISDGWETEVYSYSLRQGDGDPHQLILRMYPGVNRVNKSTHEFAVMCQLHAQGYPVPEVLHHCVEVEWLGKPFVLMEKINGTPLGTLMEENPHQMSEYVTRFFQMYVQLHSLDPQPFMDFGPQPRTPEAFLPSKLLMTYNVMVEQFQQLWVVPILEWLDHHSNRVQQPASLSVLHSDFHPLNILMDQDDQLYAIDWGSLEVGDYRHDLAWTLMLISAHGHPEFYDPMLAEYDRVAGQPSADMPFFDVLAALWRLFDVQVSLDQGGEALGMRPEVVALIREQADSIQQVYERLQNRSGLVVPEIETLIKQL